MIYHYCSKINQDDRDDLTQEDTAGLVSRTRKLYYYTVQ